MRDDIGEAEVLDERPEEEEEERSDAHLYQDYEDTNYTGMSCITFHHPPVNSSDIL